MAASSLEDQQGAHAPEVQQQGTGAVVDRAEENSSNGGEFLDIASLLADDDESGDIETSSPSQSQSSTVQKAPLPPIEQSLPPVDSIEKVLGNLEETISEIHRDVDDGSLLMELDDDDDEDIEQFVADAIDGAQDKIGELQSNVEEVASPESSNPSPIPSQEIAVSAAIGSDPIPSDSIPISNTTDLDAALSRDASALLESEFEDGVVVARNVASGGEDDASSKPREVNMANESVTIGDDGSVHVADPPQSTEHSIATVDSDSPPRTAGEPDLSPRPNAKPNPDLIDDETMELFGDGDDDDIEVIEPGTDSGTESELSDEQLESSPQTQSPVAIPETSKVTTSAAAGRSILEKLLLPVKGILAIANMPMRMLPPNVQPVFSFVALTLAIWAPLVWLLVMFVL